MSNRTVRELQAAARLIENLAARINTVRTHVAQELLYADSFSDHTPGASDPIGKHRPPLEGRCPTTVPIDAELDVWRPCGRQRPCTDHDTPVGLTPVERAADRRLQLNRDLADFDAQCKLIVIAASDAMRSADHIIGSRLATSTDTDRVMECRDGQHGKEGAIDWADPTCMKPSVKANLCQAHYSKWVRWRTANGKRTPDIEDAA